MIGDDKQDKRLDLYDNDVENTQMGKGGSYNEGKPIGQQYSKPNLIIAREGMETIDDIIRPHYEDGREYVNCSNYS